MEDREEVVSICSIEDSFLDIYLVDLDDGDELCLIEWIFFLIEYSVDNIWEFEENLDCLELIEVFFNF